MAPILSVEGLSVGFMTDAGFGETVHDVSFSVERGKTLCIVGESGSGRASPARPFWASWPGMAAAQPAVSCSKAATSAPCSEREMETIRGKGIGMVFQDPLGSLNPVHTVGRQLRETLMLHTDLDEAGRQRRAVELLRMVGIPEPERRLASYAHQFSGGMAQRVMIAMAIACSPQLLIADEPTTALDVTIQAQILDLLNRLKTEIGMGILFITHDLGVVAEMADDVVVMRHGRQVEIGPIRDVFAHPRMAYTQELLSSMPHLDRKAPVYRERP